MPVRTILSIEVFNPSASPPDVCVGRIVSGAVEVLGRADGAERGRSSDGVMDAVDRACRSAGVSSGQIDALAVSVGPGGFTALRIATTSAKVLAFALNIPVIPVPTPLVAARGVTPQERPCVIALAGKNDAAHLTLLEAGGPFRMLGVCGPEALDTIEAGCIIADDHLPQAIATRAASLGWSRQPIRLSALACLEAALGLDPVPAEQLAPLYAREPDAVTQWRARHGGR
jgi:tRNA threonylcarbamoyladenosine biosynthesis protein TsaB